MSLTVASNSRKVMLLSSYSGVRSVVASRAVGRRFRILILAQVPYHETPEIEWEPKEPNGLQPSFHLPIYGTVHDTYLQLQLASLC